jgi:DNA-binding PadR family transcriptional regulator
MHPIHHFFQKLRGSRGKHFLGGFRRGGGQGFRFDPRHGAPGDAARGFGGLGPGRKLGSADLQLLILALLAERARHGYELIKELDERSKGYYVPSPGMIYPALSYLEEVGYATVESDGPKKLYTITVAGLSELKDRRAAADAMLEQLSWVGQRLEQMRETLAQDPQTADGRSDEFDLGETQRGRGRGRGRAVGMETREILHQLKLVLRNAIGAPPEEQRRIAAILERAVADIRSKPGNTTSDTDHPANEKP